MVVVNRIEEDSALSNEWLMRDRKGEGQLINRDKQWPLMAYD